MRDILAMLDKGAHFGWEKWLQVELANKLRGLGTPKFEARFPFDLTRENSVGRVKNTHAFIDIVFRKTGDRKEYDTAVELKMKSGERGLSAVLKDLTKIAAIKDDDWRFRSVVCVLVYGAKVERIGKYQKLSAVLKKECGAQVVELGKFNALVLGWNRARTPNMTPENFRKWFEKLQLLFSKHEVSIKTFVPSAKGRVRGR